MTNLEAFKVLLDGKQSDERIASLLVVYGVDPLGEWVKSKTNPINCSFYAALIDEALKGMNATTGIKSISEGGMSISYDTASPYLQTKIKGWAADSGCSSLIDKYSGVARIKDVSYLLDR